jgi:hypothetical protein
MTALRVRTWNVENLFLPAEEGGTDDESVLQRKHGPGRQARNLPPHRR